jgi:hypothetical protein
VAINRTVTGSWAILLDLKNHGSLGTLPNFLGDAPDHVIIAGNDRLYATSTNTRNLYRIDLNPLAIRLAAFENVGNVNGVISAVATNQVPLAKYLFLADANNIYRADLSTGNIDGTSPLSSTPGPLLYIGPANTATPVSAFQYNDNQTIAGGAVSAPLVIRAMDANGKAVYNVPVVWTAAGGATLSAANSVTNMDGLAETAVTAPAVSGAFQVTARIGSSGQILATFTLTSGSGGTSNTAGISIYSGNGQIVWSTTKSDYPFPASP